MPAPLYVVYRAVPSLDAAAIARRLGGGAKVTGGTTSVAISHAGQPLRAVVVAAQVPESELDRCLPVAHLRPDLKTELAAHRAHVALVHERDVPDLPGLVALYQAAAALGGEIVGVINPISCMCLHTAALVETVAPDFIAEASAHPGATLGLWLGFVKLRKPDGGTWVVTTGMALVQLPNLAILAATAEAIDVAYEMLVAVVNYLYANRGSAKKAILPGDTLDLGDAKLIAREAYERIEEMGERTIVLERRP